MKSRSVENSGQDNTTMPINGQIKPERDDGTHVRTGESVAGSNERVIGQVTGCGEVQELVNSVRTFVSDVCDSSGGEDRKRISVCNIVPDSCRSPLTNDTNKHSLSMSNLMTTNRKTDRSSSSDSDSYSGTVVKDTKHSLGQDGGVNSDSFKSKFSASKERPGNGFATGSERVGLVESLSGEDCVNVSGRSSMTGRSSSHLSHVSDDEGSEPGSLVIDEVQDLTVNLNSDFDDEDDDDDEDIILVDYTSKRPPAFITIEPEVKVEPGVKVESGMDVKQEPKEPEVEITDWQQGKSGEGECVRQLYRIYRQDLKSSLEAHLDQSQRLCQALWLMDTHEPNTAEENVKELSTLQELLGQEQGSCQRILSQIQNFLVQMIASSNPVPVVCERETEHRASKRKSREMDQEQTDSGRVKLRRVESSNESLSDGMSGVGQGGVIGSMNCVRVECGDVVEGAGGYQSEIKRLSVAVSKQEEMMNRLLEVVSRMDSKLFKDTHNGGVPFSPAVTPPILHAASTLLSANTILSSGSVSGSKPCSNLLGNPSAVGSTTSKPPKPEVSLASTLTPGLSTVVLPGSNLSSDIVPGSSILPPAQCNFVPLASTITQPNMIINPSNLTMVLSQFPIPPPAPIVTTISNVPTVSSVSSASDNSNNSNNSSSIISSTISDTSNDGLPRLLPKAVTTPVFTFYASPVVSLASTSGKVKQDKRDKAKARFRTQFSKEQRQRLEQYFDDKRFIGGAEKMALASELNLPPLVIYNYFQNRRAYERKDEAKSLRQAQQSNYYSMQS